MLILSNWIKNKLAICKVIGQAIPLFVSLWYSDKKDAGLLDSIDALLYCILPSILNCCYMVSPDIDDSLIRHHSVSFSFIRSVYNSTRLVLTGLYAVIHRSSTRAADTGEAVQ